MMWRVALSAQPQPVDGAELLWSLVRSIERLPQLFANPLRLAMPASPARAGEEGDQFNSTCAQGGRHA